MDDTGQPPITSAAQTRGPQDDPPLHELMTHNIVGIVPEAPLHIALQLMLSAGVRHLPVLAGTGGRCAGLVLETDLARAVAAHRAAPELPAPTVGDLCRAARELGGGERRSTAARRMYDDGVDAVLVLTGTRLMGIVTATDLIRSLAAEVAVAAP